VLIHICTPVGIGVARELANDEVLQEGVDIEDFAVAARAGVFAGEYALVKVVEGVGDILRSSGALIVTGIL
jgi:hypothetical protein